MLEREWLGEDNQLGVDIWEKKYCHDGESFDEWVTRISGGNEEIGEYIKEKEIPFWRKNSFQQRPQQGRQKGYIF